VTLKTGVMADEKSALHHKNKFYFKVYKNMKPLFTFLKMISQ